MKRVVFSCLLGLTMLWITACESPTAISRERPLIVVTTGMIADMVQHIVRDSADVVAIMQPGVDPHLYKASLGDLEHIVSADYMVYNGLELEGRLSRILHQQSALKPVISVGDSISSGLIYHQNIADPHIWFDVALWRQATLTTAESLGRRDPKNQAYYVQNALAYADSLSLLDDWVRQEISSIPKHRRVLITAHDAFHYFGRAYQIEVRGLQGMSTLSEFGLRDVTDLVDFAVERDIPALFVETSISDRALRAVMIGARDRGHPLAIGGQLYADAMGQPDTDGGTYIGMVKHNVNTIVAALRPR